MQPAEVRPKPNTLEQIVKSVRNQGQIWAKNKIEISDIEGCIEGGILKFALYFDIGAFLKFP